MKLIVGLGNPGKEYEKNRHNIGFTIINNYLKKYNNISIKKDFKSEYVKINDTIFQKPLTYMNLSGDAIQNLANYYKINKDDILIIFDDMDLNIGEIKIKKNGSSGGHNGIKSIISHFGNEFNRLKIGIGKPKNKDIISYVLGNFSKEENEILEKLNNNIFNIIDDFINNIPIDKIISKYTIKK